MLLRMVWSSVPSSSFSTARLNEIVAPSRRNNERKHISGMLMFSGAQFLSILEGDDQDVARLWLALEKDPRHAGLTRIGEERCGQRWFPTWTVGYMDHADVGTRIDDLYSPLSPAPRWANRARSLMMLADSM